MFDVAHGAGIAAVWGSWARYVYREHPGRFAQFAVNVMGVRNNFDDAEKTALEGIKLLENFFKEVEMPISLHELGLDLEDEQIKELAYKCSYQNTRKIGGIKKLDVCDIEKIYRVAK